jgi:hypothetical protein
VRYVLVGEDWRGNEHFEKLDGHCGAEVVYLPRTPGVSTTQIKQAITNDRPMAKTVASEVGDRSGE